MVILLKHLQCPKGILSRGAGAAKDLPGEFARNFRRGVEI